MKKVSCTDIINEFGVDLTAKLIRIHAGTLANQPLKLSELSNEFPMRSSKHSLLIIDIEKLIEKKMVTHDHNGLHALVDFESVDWKTYHFETNSK